MKGLQFRSIAPKAPTAAPSPTVLSCQPSTTLPEASSAVSPKSILVPAQNYALMQVAGQEGTFSLVALPQSPQQQPVQKNLKLPIPRYQPMRGKSSAEKVNSKTQSPAKASVKKPAQLSSATAMKSKPPPLEPTEAQDPSSKQVILIDPAASSEISVATLLPDNAVLYPGSQPEQDLDRSTDCPSVFQTGGPKTSLAGPANNYTPVKVQSEERASMARQPSAPITVLSPTIFSKAVQIIPSPPKGKVPILPYAKVKDSLLPPASRPGGQSPGKHRPSGAPPTLSNAPDLNKTLETSASSDAALSKKPPYKRRGRKRKTMEDILSFEARKKRSLTFFRRRVPDKTPANSQTSSSEDKAVDIAKKYRSIRPKPVLVMEAAVPQLLGLSSLSAPDGLDQDRLLGQQIPGKTLDEAQAGLITGRAAVQRGMAGPGGGGAVFVGGRPLHRCPTCSRCFQFKHHLQSHMNSHGNLRPYVCPVCRKAYAHSGSLSTHMKLHHAEGRPRRSLRCEFCEKAFGYVGVYFSHLREVHRVILTVEPSISQHEENTPVEGSADSDEAVSERVDPVELQIKCGRCQAITPTFADMKLHLLYVHGEEVQVRLREGAVRGGREAEDELVKHAAHYWRQLNEKRNLVRCGSCDEEFLSFSKLKRHLHSHHQGVRESQEEGEGEEGEDEDEEMEEEDDEEEERDGKERRVSEGSHKSMTLRVGSRFNCILCSEVFDRKQEVMEHWRGRHHCETPALLWDMLICRGRAKTSTHSPN